MKKKIINFGLVLILLLPLIVFASGFKIQNENYRANHTDTWERIKKRGTLLIGVDDTFVPMDFRKRTVNWLVMMLIYLAQLRKF